MKTKLILITDTNHTEYITELSVVPQMHEWFNLQDIINSGEIEKIIQSANSWSGIRGTVEFVEYKFNENIYFPEIHILCED